MSSPLAALAAPVDTYVNYKTQEHLMDKSLENSKEMAEINYLNQRRMARDATPLAVMGMREAGLNPSSMTQPMTPGSVPGTGLASTPQAPQLQLTQALLADAQIKNINAQTEKTEVETQNMQDENATVDVNLRRHFQNLLDDPNISKTDKDFYQSIIDHAPSYSSGSLKGLKDYFTLSQQATDVMFNRFDKQYKQAVISANLRENVPDWMAKLPEQQFNELVQKIGNIQASTLLLASESALNSDKADKLKAEIQKDYAEMRHIYHEDWASLWENSDYWALFMGLAQKVLPMAVEGAVMGKVFKGGSKAAPAGSSAPLAGSSVAPAGSKTPIGTKIDVKSGTPLSRAAGSGKSRAWEESTGNIYNSFKNDADKKMFARLANRDKYGEIEARKTWYEYLAASNRKGLSYSQWMQKTYFDGFH